MTYIALVEHPLNNFTSMDQRIFEGIIKPKVLDMIKNDVQGLFEEIEQNLQSVATSTQQMKANKSEADTFQKLFDECEVVNQTVMA